MTATTIKRLAAASIIAALAIGPSAAQASPQIVPLKPIAVKWILPPKGSAMYEAQKAWAEANGYETVEFEDRTYPSRP